MFTLAINSARGPGVSTRWAARLICAIPALLILLLLPKTAFPQATADGVQASIAPPRSMASPGSAPVKIVQMNDDAPMYDPSNIVITAGQTVEWHNNGQVSHSVVDDAKRAAKPDDSLIPNGVDTFSSGGIMPGGNYRHTFSVPGRYRYFCASHELDDMVGEVTVRPAERGEEIAISQAKPEQSTSRDGRHTMSPQELANAVQSLIAPPPEAAQSGRGPVKLVQMNDDAPMYKPSSLVITVGQTVEWHNNGQVSHSVTDDAARAVNPDDYLIPHGAESFNSGSIVPGGTYKHTFAVPGRYRYFSMSHDLGDMAGDITVLPAPPDTEPLISQAKSQPPKNLERTSDSPVPDP